ncbi:hypothetical protein GH714_019900 [Hevea brasiliensis]|uniref:Uncharacterized protein n=1 Tax=Hevea brasiliensis TaxID=3981 RepID=A0A6A6M280_HEVBR|nr:hypothetical protein GH714_019900 [Hevea brasiliensis]
MEFEPRMGNDKGSDSPDDKEIEESGQLNGKVGLRRRRQVIRRSNMLAKQVISIHSALSLGFVSQIWVDTTSVRGFSFNVNSGAVELLELDSFGISIIPSSLVSTYALPIEDVLEVLSDTVIVHEAAASRIQKLTKGFWDAQNVSVSIDEIEGYSDSEISLGSDHGRSTRRSSRRQKFHPKIRESEDDWDFQWITYDIQDSDTLVHQQHQ